MKTPSINASPLPSEKVNPMQSERHFCKIVQAHGLDEICCLFIFWGQEYLPVSLGKVCGGQELGCPYHIQQHVYWAWNICKRMKQH